VTARQAMLDRIRAALGTLPPPQEVPRSYRTTGSADATTTVARFVERVGEYRADVREVSQTALPEALAGLLAGTARLLVPPGLPPDWLTELAATIDVVVDDGLLGPRELDGFDAVVTGCAVGIADTGTIILDAGEDQGRRAITLVPDRHVCVVRADQVVETVPEGLSRVDPARPLTLVSGPSATSDIELNRVEGVHGPRVLDVIVVRP